MDAYNEFRKGNVGKGLINTGWALASLVPGGMLMRGLGGTARLGKAMAGAGKLHNIKPLLSKGSAPFTGPFVNAWRRMVNPAKNFGNDFMTGLSNAAPSLARPGMALNRASVGANKWLSSVQGGPNSIYARTVRSATLPLMAMSMAPAFSGGEVTTDDIARMSPSMYDDASNFRTRGYKSASVKEASYMTIGDLTKAVGADPTLSDSERREALWALQRSFPGYAQSTVITPNMAGAAGAIIAWLVARYAGMSMPIKALSALGGFGLGRAIHDRLVNPYPGYRSVE
jgi:hypothetical protein